jgi:hypothetical protein
MTISDQWGVGEISREVMEDAVKYATLTPFSVAEHKTLDDIFLDGCMPEHRFLLDPKNQFDESVLSDSQKNELNALAELAAEYEAKWLSDDTSKEDKLKQTLKAIELVTILQGGAYEYAFDYAWIEFNNPIYKMPVAEGLAVYKTALELYGKLEGLKGVGQVRKTINAFQKQHC